MRGEKDKMEEEMKMERRKRRSSGEIDADIFWWWLLGHSVFYYVKCDTSTSTSWEETSAACYKKKGKAHGKVSSMCSWKCIWLGGWYRSLWLLLIPEHLDRVSCWRLPLPWSDITHHGPLTLLSEKLARNIRRFCFWNIISSPNILRRTVDFLEASSRLSPTYLWILIPL